MFLEKCQNYFVQIWESISFLWRSKEITVAPIVEKKRRKRSYNKQSKNEILHNLDKYFKYIRQMKKADKESYDLYRKIGAQFISTQTIDGFEDTISLDLPERWKSVRPSFGCIFMPAEHDEKKEKKEDSINPRFIYFRRHKSLSGNVQAVPAGWDLYTFHIAFYFENREHTYDAAVAIDGDNQVHALQIKISDDLVINTKRGVNRGKYLVKRKKWALPDLGENRKGKPKDQVIKESFCLAANFWELAQFKEVEVRAVKGSLAARFNITGTDTARLFQDRQRIENKKTRIFHAVRPYVKKNGKSVKLHFKGERNFNWNGYEISIYVPGKDFAAYLPEFEAAAIPEEEFDASDRDGLDSKKLGEFIVKNTVGNVPNKLSRYSFKR